MGVSNVLGLLCRVCDCGVYMGLSNVLGGLCKISGLLLLVQCVSRWFYYRCEQCFGFALQSLWLWCLRGFE